MKTVFTLLFFLIANTLYSQNLVINPSFEDYSTCPNSIHQSRNAIGWSPARLDQGSTDYYNSCSKDHYSSVPQNQQGYQIPRTGKAYAGFIPYSKTTPSTFYFYREYIQGQFKEPLVVNKKYLISFYVNLANPKYYHGWASINTAIHSIGAYLSSYPPNQDSYIYPGEYAPHTFGNIPVVPQVINNPQQFLSDTLGWTEVKGIYTAKGGKHSPVPIAKP